MNTKPYLQLETVWPQIGRHILARFDDSTIVVYQAFCPEKANFAVEYNRFSRSKYNFEQMTWIRTNFLWMMYRAGWATKKDQERILAITLKRAGFDKILREASEAKIGDDGKAIKASGMFPDLTSCDDVRLQWDPDHHPSGAILNRCAIQLGLRGDILRRFHEDWIVDIEDITKFVHRQYEHVKNKDWENLHVPEEEVYVPEDEQVRRHIRLDMVSQVESDVQQLGASGGHATVTNTSCTRMVFHERYDAVLCLIGAFNPVHSRHIQVMTEGRAWLEETTAYRIIAGLLAVASDGYVSNKCKQQKCIQARHRIKLCELACGHTDWLRPFETPVGSAEEAGRKFTDEMPGTRITVIVIVGADRAISNLGKARWHTASKGGVVTVCIGRQGQTQAVRDLYEKDLFEDKVKNSRFYLIPKELDNVCSTDIRRELEKLNSVEDRKHRTATIIDMVYKGWMYENVGQYILDNYDDLFF